MATPLDVTLQEIVVNKKGTKITFGGFPRRCWAYIPGSRVYTNKKTPVRIVYFPNQYDYKTILNMLNKLPLKNHKKHIPNLNPDDAVIIISKTYYDRSYRPSNNKLIERMPATSVDDSLELSVTYLRLSP
jgi:hypothetical protein